MTMLVAGRYGPVRDADARLDAVFLIAPDGFLVAAGIRGAMSTVRAYAPVNFYGWVIDGVLYGPGDRVPSAPVLVWRRFPHGDIRGENKNTLVALASVDNKEANDRVIFEWSDGKPDSAGGNYIKRGLPKIVVDNQ